MVKFLIYALALCCVTVAARADQYYGGFAGAGSISNTDTLLICQNAAGCGPADHLKSVTIGKLRGACQSILGTGGVGDGTTDNAAAFTAALSVVPGKACVYFPPGVYRFNSAVSHTIPGVANTAVTIMGAGEDVTELYWPNAGGGITINVPSQGPEQMNSAFHVRDMTLSTGAAAGGTALTVIGAATTDIAGAYTPQSDISHVTLRSSEGYWTGTNVNYWTTGVDVQNVNNITFDTLNVGGKWNSGTGYSTVGTGVNIRQGSPTTYIPVLYKFVNSSFNAVGTGIIYGGNVQGMQVVSTEFTGGNIGILTNNDSTNARDQLSVTSSQFNVATTGIKANSAAVVPDLFVIGSLFLIPSGGTGIDLLQNHRPQIIGNNFANTTTVGQGTGVSIAGTVLGTGSVPIGGVLANNHFSGLALGWTLTSTGTGWTVLNNKYTLNTTNFTNTARAGAISEGKLSVVAAGAPVTIASGFGTSPSIAGHFNAGRVTVGTGGAASGVLAFGETLSIAPICSAQDETVSQAMRATASTTQLTITGTMAAADKVTYQCFGLQ